MQNLFEHTLICAWRAHGPVMLIGAPQRDVTVAERVPPGVQHLSIEAKDALSSCARRCRRESSETIINTGAIHIVDPGEQMPESQSVVFPRVEQDDTKQRAALCGRMGFEIKFGQRFAKRGTGIFKVRSARADLRARSADGSCRDEGFVAVEFEPHPADGGAQQAGAGL